jgi:hypothetical protein
MRSYSRRQRDSHPVTIDYRQVTGSSLRTRNVPARGVERRSESGGVVDLGSSGFDNRFGQVEPFESGHIRSESGVAKVGSLAVSELVGLNNCLWKVS